ncbi:MAG: oxidoreductase [Candidatus Acidiferrales bacterium]
MRVFTLSLAAVVAVLCGASVGTSSRFAPVRELRTNSRDANTANDVHWSVQTSGIDTNLRGISAAYISDAIAARRSSNSPDERHIAVWACGSNGVILLSKDLGKTWKRLHVVGGETLDFRGIVAFDETTAYLMSSGEGDKSRIYKTMDGGETWKLEFTDKRPSFFLDALVCDRDCYALSDPVDGKFVLVGAQNGENWKELPSDAMPAALPGEGAFAASGTALAMNNDGDLFFGTGGGKAARVFHSPDFGKTWTAAETPIASGNASSGIFSIVATPWAAIAVGGDYKDPSRPYRVAAYSTDRGKTWSLATQQPGGYRSAVVALYGAMLAVGPTGEDISDDFGAHWKRTDSLDLNAAFVLDIDNGWAAGAKGTIARLVNRTQYQIRNDVPRDDPARATTSLSR